MQQLGLILCLGIKVDGAKLFNTGNDILEIAIVSLASRTVEPTKPAGVIVS